ncbi:hypothetical protein TNCV_4378231 [Trichonephila clavipes]|nr:hypothetical protein TNCV_4378231 [Trichonephila clavipes]
MMAGFVLDAMLVKSAGPECIIERRSGLLPGVMICGAISYHGRCNLLRIEDNLNCHRSPCHDFDPSITKDSRRVGQRCALNLPRVKTSSRWCGVVVRRGVPAEVSSTSLDHGSKLRGPSPKALVGADVRLIWRGSKYSRRRSVEVRIMENVGSHPRHLTLIRNYEVRRQ